MLARLLGLLSLLPSRVGRGPKDNLLIPEVDNLATCLKDCVSSAAAIEDPLAVLPPVRFLLLIVTLGGM